MSERTGCHCKRKLFEIRDGEALSKKQAEAVPISNGVNAAAGKVEEKDRV
jgi:nitrite reductase/ring-hydroxylating ferredoxin subunit